MMFSRRAFLASSTALALTGPLRAETEFSRESVIALASDLAEQDYAPRATVPQDWLDLTYPQYRALRFRTDRSLWRESDKPYEVDFFAPGLYFPRPVQIDTVQDGATAPVPFDLSRFKIGTEVEMPDLSADDSLGWSGFRLRTDLDLPGKKTEFCVFQGASYFRAIGIGQAYGLSARGLALKTGDPDGEEFPEFTRFWLETPAPGQRNMVVHALMDSPSVTGAYRFDITPGPSCVMEVEATLFPRVELTHAGIGPLTSMFLFDATDRTRFDDFRPAVHDSDGLLIANGAGETLWRPLANPRALQVSSFVDQGPRGFGLMQRSRRFGDFDDLESLYHRRPGLWVEPRGDWGAGAVTLVEIPADKEIYDNIVAYWRPRTPYPAGQRVDLAYRLTWCDRAPLADGLPRVMDTHMGAGLSGGRVVIVEFEPHPLLDENPDTLEALISSVQVDPSPGVLERNPETGGLRLAFRFEPGDRDHVELRAQLRRGDAPASEVWLYRWTR